MADDESQLEGLLEPTLAVERATTASAGSIYSLRACFFVAFFGGPFAILLFAGLNSQRLGRLASDAWVYALGAVATAAFVMAMGQAALADSFPEWLALLGEGRSGMRNATRILSLALFGLVFLMHRKFFKAASMHREDGPSPWLPGIVASVIGTGISIALIAVAAGLP